MSEPVRDIDSLSFEEALRRLDVIAQQLESGRTDLADSLARYEEGIRLLRHCQVQLQSAEQKIELLKNAGSTGPIQTEPIDPETLRSQETTPGRSTARKRPAPKAKKSEAGPASDSANELPESGIPNRKFDFGDSVPF